MTPEKDARDAARETRTFLISVAAELSGMHAQTCARMTALVWSAAAQFRWRTALFGATSNSCAKCSDCPRTKA